VDICEGVTQFSENDGFGVRCQVKVVVKLGGMWVGFGKMGAYWGKIVTISGIGWEVG